MEAAGFNMGEGGLGWMQGAADAAGASGAPEPSSMSGGDTEPDGGGLGESGDMDMERRFTKVGAGAEPLGPGGAPAAAPP